MSTNGTLEARYRARSLWLDGVPGPLAPRPSLPGDVECDVAIVGAGFTGLWTAYHLARRAPGHAHRRDRARDRRLRARPGRNGGWVSGGLVGSAGAYERSHGRDGVVRAHPRDACRRRRDRRGRSRARASTAASARAARSSPPPSEPQRERLLAGHRELRGLGIGEEDVRLLDGGRVGRDRARRRLRCRRRSRPTRPASTRPGSRAASPRPASGSASRSTSAPPRRRSAPGARPTARRARCGPTSCSRRPRPTPTQLPGQRLRYLPLYSLMIATEPLPDAVWDELGWRDGLLSSDSHYLFFYAQRTADGRIAHRRPRRAVPACASPIDERNERNAEVRARLVRTIRRHFPAAAGARDHPPLGRAARRAPRLVDVVDFDRCERGRLGRRLHRPRRRRREHLRPHARRPRARPRHRPRHACPGSGTAAAGGSPSRSASSPRARSSAARERRPRRGRDRPAGAAHAAARARAAAALTASRGATRVRPCPSH